MNVKDLFKGELEGDWKSLCELWLREPYLMQSEVGPLWETPPQHEACIEFSKRYPDSKGFLIGKLAHQNALIAAYAFKCLVRVTDLKPEEIPEAVRLRKDRITTRHHSSREDKAYANQRGLLAEQERTLGWQNNELAQYKRSMGSEDQKKKKPGTSP
jgi:hypothetical protein